MINTLLLIYNLCLFNHCNFLEDTVNATTFTTQNSYVNSDFLINKDTIASERNIAASDDPSDWKGANLTLRMDSTGQRNLKQSDFDFAAEAGANVIRLVVHADPDEKRNTPFFDADYKMLPPDNNPGIDQLKKAVEMARKDNLKIIIDMHTLPGTTTAKIWEDETFWNRTTALWTTIANAFKNNTDVVGYDLMNEPTILKALVQKTDIQQQMMQGRWAVPKEWTGTARDYKLQITNLIKAIQAIDANKYIIVEGFGIYGSPVNFNWMPYFGALNKIVYSFHMYVPTPLTSAELSKPGNADVDKINFNPNRDMAKIDKAFAPVLAFQKQHNVPIFVGEFGISDDAVKNLNGACWLSAVVDKMDQYKWGWTYWNFWMDIRSPKSKDDPRYVILSAAMKGQPIKNYCK